MQALLEEIRSLVGDDRMTTDALECTYYSQDVYTKAAPAAVVVAPADTEQLAAVVKAAVKAGNAVIARGGGMSYTKGYVPSEENSVLIDMAPKHAIFDAGSLTEDD